MNQQGTYLQRRSIRHVKRTISAFALLFVLGWIVCPNNAMAQGDDVQIRLTVRRVERLHNTENFPDTGDVDYYVSNVAIAGREQPQSEIVWDQPVIEPHWTWAVTVDPDDLAQDSPGRYRTSVIFELWDSDWLNDTPIAIFLSGRRDYRATVVYDDSSCGIDSVSALIGDVGPAQARHVSGTWEFGVCRLDMVTSGNAGDRARVEYTIQLSRQPTEAMIPLYSWWSPGREDNAAFTSAEWAGEIGDRRVPDYDLFRKEALVFSPFASQPPQTAPLYEWYSPSRGDHFTTTDPRWAGSPGDPARTPDYQPLGIIGYVYTTPGSGRVPLHSWYDHGRGDNFITSQPAWVGSAGDTRTPNYGYVRLEGYGLSVDEADTVLTPFSGRFTGSASSDGSRADIVVDLVQLGGSVSGRVDVGPGLRINSGCIFGIRSFPARAFSISGTTSADSARLLEAATVSVSGIAVDIFITASLSGAGETLAMTLDIDLPRRLESLGCRDRVVSGTLIRS